MKKIIFFSVSIAIIVATACMAGNSKSANNATNTSVAADDNTGRLTAQTRQVSDFTALDLSLNVDVRLLQGTENKVVVEGDAETQKRIICKNKGNSLIIKETDSKKMWSKTDSKALVTVYFKNINKLEAANNGSTSGAINQADLLTLSLNNNGSTTLDLNAVSVNATLNCNGNVKFTGAATQAKIKNNNNGSFIAKDFKTVSLSLKNDANGSTSVFASSQIDIESSANGNLSYYGNPSKKTIKNDGNGSISAE